MHRRQTNKRPQNYTHLATLILLASFLLTACAATGPGQNGSDYQTTKDADSPGTFKNRSTSELVTGGLVNLSAGNHSLAKMLFLKAIEQSPDAYQAYMGLGELEYRDENYEAAFIHYDKAVSFSPQNVQAMIGKAKSVRQQNKLNAAIEEINKAIATSPNDIAVLTELAIIYDLLGKESLSAPIYQEILERTPDQAASSNNIGLSLLSQKKYDLAIIAFQRALSLDSKDSRIKNNLATAYALYGDELQAISLFKETVGEAAAYNNLGYLYLTLDKLDDAERALRKAMDINPVYYEKAQENLERLQQLRDNPK